MANNTIYANIGTYGVNDTPSVGPLMQAQTGVVMLFTLADLTGAPIDITHESLSGTITNNLTSETAELTGALAIVDGAAGVFSWTTADEDVSTAGEFTLLFVAGVDIRTLPAYLSIIETPGITDTFDPSPLVGVTAAERAWLTAALSWLPDGNDFAYIPNPEGATDGHVWTADGADGAGWEAPVSDVGDLTTAGLTATNMLRVAAAGGLEERTPAQVLGDIGAAAASSLANYLALAGGTMSGGIVMADQLLTRPVIKDYGETVNAIGSIGGGTQDIDLTLGNVVSGTVDTSTTTFTFSNPPASGTNGSFTLYLTNGGSQTVNWPAAVKWAGGTAPTLTASGVDILTFTTLDGGTTWYGFPAGLDMT